MDQIKELEKERTRIYKQAEPINKALNKLRDEKALKYKLKLIGKCFVFNNSYGPDDKWKLYSKFSGVNEEGNLIIITCEKTNTGDIEIEKRTDYGFAEHLQEKEISPLLFNQKLNEMLYEINGYE